LPCEHLFPARITPPYRYKKQPTRFQTADPSRSHVGTPSFMPLLYKASTAVITRQLGLVLPSENNESKLLSVVIGLTIQRLFTTDSALKTSERDFPNKWTDKSCAFPPAIVTSSAGFVVNKCSWTRRFHQQKRKFSQNLFCMLF